MTVEPVPQYNVAPPRFISLAWQDVEEISNLSALPVQILHDKLARAHNIPSVAPFLIIVAGT